MYNVTLIHLAPDAGSAAVEWERSERREIRDEEMRGLLQSFSEIDAVENATTDPEIRVQVRGESYFIRSGQRKLIFYDALNREAPGQILTVDEAMAELDGSAIASRTAAPFLFPEAGPPADLGADSSAAPPSARPSPARVIAMIVVIGALVSVHIGLRLPSGPNDSSTVFDRMDTAEAADLLAATAGVYLTGTQPGQHGIALTTAGELRLFELRGVDAPGVVHAAIDWGRVGSALCLATDQPGGLITLADRDTMLYCGETYKRVP